jgi:tetratricopeptide (TPR) repeat protein
MAKKPRSASAVKAQSGPSSSAQAGGSDFKWLQLPLVVLAITAACYLPSLNNNYVNWDDTANITENPNLLLVGKGQSWINTISNIFDLDRGNVIGNYNPLAILTFAVEKSLNGGEFSPELSHTINLLLHLLTVFMVMRLLWSMGFGRWGVLTGGLLFGIHPMRVESVVWASERKDVLFALFFFWALIYYVKWLKQSETGESRKRTYWIMLVLALLSCLSKVQAVALPLSMLALDYWFRRPIHVTLIWEKTPFWLLSIAFGLINLYTLGVQGSDNIAANYYSFLERLCIGAYSYCTYLYKALFPYPMSPLYSYPNQLPWTIYAAPAGFALVLAALVWAWKKGQRVWVFGVLFFTFNVMFVLQIFSAGQGFLADRFTYVAYFGLFAIAAYYVDIIQHQGNAARKIYALLGSLTLIFGAWTVRQSSIWKDGNTLWSHVADRQAGGKEFSILPYVNRGRYLLNERGDFEGALKDFSRAIELAPNNPDYWKIRGKTYFLMAGSEKYKSQKKELLEKAIREYTEAMTKPGITPQSKSDALVSRGAAYGTLGLIQQSLSDLTESIELDPNNKTAYANRAVAFMNLGQYERALTDYEQCVRLDPANASMWYECGMMQRSLKKNEEAIKSLNFAIKLNPKNGLAYLERARAKAGFGNYTGAKEDYQEAQKRGIQLESADIKALQVAR